MSVSVSWNNVTYEACASPFVSFFLFHHLLRATYVDHGKVQKARFLAITVPRKVPVKMWLPRPPLRQ